jgi:hypothetical protein
MKFRGYVSLKSDETCMQVWIFGMQAEISERITDRRISLDEKPHQVQKSSSNLCIYPVYCPQAESHWSSFITSRRHVEPRGALSRIQFLPTSIPDIRPQIYFLRWRNWTSHLFEKRQTMKDNPWRASHFYEQVNPEIVSSNNSIRNLHLLILF